VDRTLFPVPRPRHIDGRDTPLSFKLQQGGKAGKEGKEGGGDFRFQIEDFRSED
jgi:hypothetical protein